MKKIFLSALLFVMLISMSFENSYATCPSGYTEYTTSGLYTYSSGMSVFTCHITIVYCCKWDNTLKQVVSEIQSFQGTYGNCISAIPNWPHFLDWLHQTVGAASDISCAPTYPPCDDPNINYYENIVSSASCWQYENFQPYTGDDFHLRMKKCEDSGSKCVSTWRVCLNYNYTPATINRTFISRTLVGTPNCSTTIPTLPEEGSYLWETYWTTYCFVLPCN
jgi:hypothetical protein